MILIFSILITAVINCASLEFNITNIQETSTNLTATSSDFETTSRYVEEIVKANLTRAFKQSEDYYLSRTNSLDLTTQEDIKICQLPEISIYRDFSLFSIIEKLRRLEALYEESKITVELIKSYILILFIYLMIYYVVYMLIVHVFE